MLSENMQEKYDEIIQKKAEDCTTNDLEYLSNCMDIVHKKVHSKAVKKVEEIFKCVNNFQRCQVIRAYFYDKIDSYSFDDDAKNSGIEDKIHFIHDYGCLIRIREKDGTISGYKYPEIFIGDRDMKRITSQSWQAIIGANRPPRIYQYNGQILRLEFRNGKPEIKYVKKHDFLHILETAADFFKFRKKNQGDIKLEKKAAAGEPVSEIAKIPAHPTETMANYLLATPDPALPVIEGIKSTPYFDADGELVFMPGYNEKTGIFLHDPKRLSGPDLKHLSIDEAKSLIFDEVLKDFMFVSDSDAAHAIAVLLHPFIRCMVDGPTPLFLCDAPTARTGKTLLVEVLTYIGTGQDVHMQSLPPDENEIRKQITSTLVGYPTHIVYDNIRHKIDSASLSMALTAISRIDRILGITKNVVTPVKCCWIATGNNLTTSEEIAGRSIWIRMDTGLERPGERTGFKHPHIFQYVKDNQNILMWAAIALVENWLQMGRPKFSGIPLGKYESWTETTGGILEACGIKGFMEDREQFYDAVDLDTVERNAVVFLWHEAFGVQPVLASELAALDQMPISDPRKMGAFLRDNSDTRVILRDEKGKVAGDFKIVKAGVKYKTTQWVLQRGDLMKKGDVGDVKKVISIKKIQ